MQCERYVYYTSHPYQITRPQHVWKVLHTGRVYLHSICRLELNSIFFIMSNVATWQDPPLTAVNLEPHR